MLGWDLKGSGQRLWSREVLETAGERQLERCHPMVTIPPTSSRDLSLLKRYTGDSQDGGRGPASNWAWPNLEFKNSRGTRL